MTFRQNVRRFKMWLRQKKMRSFCALVRPWDKMMGFKALRPPLDLRLGRSAKILFLRTDGKVGDFIVATFALKEIADSFDVKIDLVGSDSVLDVAAASPFIGKRFNIRQKIKSRVIKSKILNAIILGLILRKEHYDLIIDIQDDGLKLETAIIIWLAKAKYRLGFDPPAKCTIYNVALTYDFRAYQHFTNVYNVLLEALGIHKIPQESIQYVVDLPREVINAGKEFYDRCPLSNKIVFNVFAGGRSRNFTLEQIKAVIDALSDVTWILLGPWKNLQSLQTKLSPRTNVIYPIELLKKFGILGSLSLIKAAERIFTVDTFAVHAAMAWEKRFFGIYSKFKASSWGLLKEMPGTYLEVYPNETDVPHLPAEKLVQDLQKWMIGQ